MASQDAEAVDQEARRLSVSSCGDSGISNSAGGTPGQHFLETKSVKAFRTNHDYLYAMTEDLAEWLNFLYDLSITVETFFDELESGVILCTHAGQVQSAGEAYFVSQNSNLHRVVRIGNKQLKLPQTGPSFKKSAKQGTFMARDNIAQFINWCRSLGLRECVLFETEDLVLRKNTKHVILCLLEIARVGSQFGMEVPELIQLEQEIDAEMSGDSGLASPIVDYKAVATERNTAVDEKTNTPKIKARGSPCSKTGTSASQEDLNQNLPPYKRRRQRWACDMKSLDELVRELVSECSCEETFPMKRLDEGKYLFGDNQMLIFVRVLRNHVMVRVGGGWDSLEHLLFKHDPCRRDKQQCFQSGVPVHHEYERRRKESSLALGANTSSHLTEQTSLSDDATEKSKESTKILKTLDSVDSIKTNAQTTNSNNGNFSHRRSKTQLDETQINVGMHEDTSKQNGKSQKDDKSTIPATTNRRGSQQIQIGRTISDNKKYTTRKNSSPNILCDRQTLLKPDVLKQRSKNDGIQNQGMMKFASIQETMREGDKNRAKCRTPEITRKNTTNAQRNSPKTSIPKQKESAGSKTNPAKSEEPQLKFRQNLDDLKTAISDLSTGVGDKPDKQGQVYSQMEKEYSDFSKSAKTSKTSTKTASTAKTNSRRENLTHGYKITQEDFDSVDSEFSNRSDSPGVNACKDTDESTMTSQSKIPVSINNEASKKSNSGIPTKISPSRSAHSVTFPRKHLPNGRRASLNQTTS